MLGRRRHRRDEGAPQTEWPRLRGSVDVVERWRADGGGPEAALRWSLRQVEGLRREVDDPKRWARLVQLVARTGDPWNAEDWPYGFDPLVLCAPLCADVSFECARCPVGKRQDARACAHPHTLFGLVGEHVRTGDRDRLRAHLAHLEEVLRELGGASPKPR